MLIFSRFAGGEQTAFDLSSLKDILAKHQCEWGEPGDHGYISVYFPTEDGEQLIGSDDGGIATDGESAIEFAIGQPVYDDALKRLSYALLDGMNLCAYGDGSAVYSARPIDESAIPEEILADCSDGLRIVSSATQLW